MQTLDARRVAVLSPLPRRRIICGVTTSSTRDTERNLRLFAFVVKYATAARSRSSFEQYSPYVTMMRVAPSGHQALAKTTTPPRWPPSRGRRSIRQFLRDYSKTDSEANAWNWDTSSVGDGRSRQDDPLGPAERLETQLTQAVALEDYEEAGPRDQLRPVAWRPRFRYSRGD